MTDEMPVWGSPEPHRDQPEPADPGPARELVCPVCRGTTFSEEEGKIETRWGMSNHVLTMRVCQRCSYVLFFRPSGAPSWFY